MGIVPQKPTRTYRSVDGTDDDEACHDVERPEQRFERTQLVSLELYALAMEDGCDEGENAKGGHLEDESSD